MAASPSVTSWDELFPEGRDVFIEADGLEAIITTMREIAALIGEDAFTGSSVSFFIPAGRVEEIYGAGRWALGS